MPIPRRPALMLAAIAAALALAVVLATRPGAASAHPLGNFTINHYDRIEVSETGIEVYSILDMAEIPAFQERQRIDANGDGAIDEAEQDTWASAAVDGLARHITLHVNGADVALAPISRDVTFPEGQGGLSLLRFTARYSAALPEDWRDAHPAVEFRDDNDPDRIGWREIIVRGGPGVDVAGASVPDHDVSNELLAYPQDSLSSPLDVRAATFSFQPGAGSAPIAAVPVDSTHTRATRGNPDGALGRFTELVSRRDMSIGFVALALLAALGFGAIHALSPGHGKTIVAAYLVGSRGTAKHALILGLTVTATHTSSVYALGFITLYLSEYIVPETLYPWLGVASGALIVLMGASLFIGRLRSSGAVRSLRARLRYRSVPASARSFAAERGSLVFAAAHTTDPTSRSRTHTDPITPDAHHGLHTHTERAHTHGDHGAGHDHSHDSRRDSADEGVHRHGWGPAHTHAIPGQDGEPVTWRRLVGLGIFGGLLPCPSAIVVMLSAIALHRVAFGLLLIVFFSLGLAGVLTGIGFALVYSRAIVRRLPVLRRLATRADAGAASLLIRAFPVMSAAAVVAAGLVITLRAASQQGWL
jgi:ABC-type nickel/cobalt efflux system permease component RcnA